MTLAYLLRGWVIAMPTQRGLHVALLLVVWLPLWESLAVAASVTGNVVVSSADRRPAKTRDHSGAVVWLEPVGTAVRPAPSAPKQATMVQRNKTFIPHVLAIEVGTAVDLPNNDAIIHNVFSNYDGQVFDVQLYAPQTAKRVVFRRPGMVRVFCNIHETMSAVIAVVETPYFAVTGTDGRFTIQAPAGEYRLRVWHEHAPAEALAKLERRMTLADTDTALGEIQLPVSGQGVVPHKDKYGRDYAARADEHIFYPGARR